MENYCDHPWYDAELMELRVKQRRWLYGLRHMDNGVELPVVEPRELQDVDPVLAELRWRQTIDRQTSDEFAELLDIAASRVAARQVYDYFDRTTMSETYAHTTLGTKMEQHFRKACSDTTVPNVDRYNEADYRAIAAALLVADQLAMGAADALGRWSS